MSETVIYDELFTDSLYNILKNNKYDIFLDGVKPKDYLNPKLYERLIITDNHLKMKRLKGDKEPFGIAHLNTRLELVPGVRQSLCPIHIYSKIKFINRDFQSTFLQIGYIDSNNKTQIPLFTLDTRDTINSYNSDSESTVINLNARCRFNDKSDLIRRYKISNYKERIFNTIREFDIFFYPHTDNGYIRVYMDKELVFERIDTKTCFTNDGHYKLQYGLYATDYTLKQNEIEFYRYRVCKTDMNYFKCFDQTDVTDVKDNKNTDTDTDVTDVKDNDNNYNIVYIDGKKYKLTFQQLNE